MRDFVLPEMWDKLSVVVRTGRKLETRSPKFETNSNIEIEKGRVLRLRETGSMNLGCRYSSFAKAAWGCRTPRRWRAVMGAAPSARSWSAAALI